MESKTRANAAEPPAIVAAEISSMHRRLIVSMQEDLLPLAEAIDGYCQMLVDAAAEYPPEFCESAAKMRVAARELYAFVRESVDPDRCEAESPRFDDCLRNLRHDIGNRLNHVVGYCQLLMMDQQEQFFGALADELEKIKELCASGEVTLLAYKGGAQACHAEGSDSRKDAPKIALDGVIGVTSRKPMTLPATILVADDSPSSRDVLVRILEREGHTVAEAVNGREALEILAAREFDLVLLDFLMPEMNGFEALKLIKADERLRHTPVIIVSALDTMYEVVACIEVGAEDFLTKPVDLQLLRARTSACLEKKRLREREFGQFFTPELARHFVRHPELLKEAHEAEVSILFCDIRQFSHISELLGPSDTVAWLSDVMAVLSDCVINQGGVLVDYIGDELMAMWGAPEKQPRHGELACHAALDMLAQMPMLNNKWEPVIGHKTCVGIGVNTGVAHVGNTGSQRKFKYGPLGNAVNLASRVQGVTKYLGSDLLVTGNTLAQLHGKFVSRRLCMVRVVNIERPVDLHELMADETDKFRSLKQHYEQALTEFENQQFRVAASILGQLLVDHPHDGPSLMLMSRVIEMLLHENEDFDPVWELTRK